MKNPARFKKAIGVIFGVALLHLIFGVVTAFLSTSSVQADDKPTCAPPPTENPPVD